MRSGCYLRPDQFLDHLTVIKIEQLISIHFNVDSPPLKITFFVRIAHGREVFERQDTILEIDQLGINMEDNIMSQRTELQKRTKKDDDI